jgi:ubiquinone/menaquinone biosynthesis C-methylase UbiE
MQYNYFKINDQKNCRMPNNIETAMETQFVYGNWIRVRILLILGLCTLAAGVLVFLPFGAIYRLIMAFLFVIAFISFLIPFFSYVMFSQKGGNYQEKVYHLIIQSLGPAITGRILDIGSGNGVLAVKLAQQDEAEVTGMDYWGKDWEYSKGVCEKNAQLGRVADRVHFQKGDAAALEFPNDTFDGVTSNLTFHEVRSVQDKREVLREALRVVKPGGRFAFVDYFYEAKYYGKAPEFEAYLNGLKLAQVAFKPLGEMIALPIFLKHPKIFGKVGIIYGRK